MDREWASFVAGSAQGLLLAGFFVWLHGGDGAQAFSLCTVGLTAACSAMFLFRVSH